MDHGVLDAAAGRLRELSNLTTAGREVLLHGDFYLGNILVHGGHVSALIDFEFSRMGPRTWSSSRSSGPSTRKPVSAVGGRR